MVDCEIRSWLDSGDDGVGVVGVVSYNNGIYQLGEAQTAY